MEFRLKTRTLKEIREDVERKRQERKAKAEGKVTPPSLEMNPVIERHSSRPAPARKSTWKHTYGKSIKDAHLHFMIDKEDHKILESLMDESKLSKAAVIRTLLLNSDRLNIFGAEVPIDYPESSINSAPHSSRNKSRKTKSIHVVIDSADNEILEGLKNQSKLTTSDIMRILIRHGNRLNIFNRKLI